MNVLVVSNTNTSTKQSQLDDLSIFSSLFVVFFSVWLKSGSHSDQSCVKNTSVRKHMFFSASLVCLVNNTVMKYSHIYSHIRNHCGCVLVVIVRINRISVWIFVIWFVHKRNLTPMCIYIQTLYALCVDVYESTFCSAIWNNVEKIDELRKWQKQQTQVAITKKIIDKPIWNYLSVWTMENVVKHAWNINFSRILFQFLEIDAEFMVKTRINANQNTMDALRSKISPNSGTFLSQFNA